MRWIKHILFIAFFLVFLGELIQNHLPFIYVYPLNGATEIAQKPTISIDNWLSGNYQDSLMKNFEQNLDLHPFLIRFNNQIGYNTFGEIKSDDIIKGKNDVLYSRGYINTYFGKDFVGDDDINNKVNMLAYIQTELKKHNIDFLFVIAPGKPSILPEYIPSIYDTCKKNKTNREAYIEGFKKYNINYIDFTAYFQKLKTTSKYPLFPKCGVHWSGYGATVAADSLIKYMEKMRNIDMLDYYDAGGETTTKPRNTDADIGDLMNLLNPIPSYQMYYPKIVFKKDSTKTKPNVLIIGDSFVWTWISFYEYFPSLCNNHSAFWYYNHDVEWCPIDDKHTLTANMNLKEQIKNRDYILIVNTEPSLTNAGQFFINQMFEMLHKDTTAWDNELKCSNK